MTLVCSALLLLLAVSSTAQAAVTQIKYKPEITSQPIGGKITGSTFSLGLPVCIFIPPNVSGQDMVWLVVGKSKEMINFKADGFNVLKKPAYQDFQTSSYYLTLGTQAVNFPCDSNRAPIRVLRVGNSSSCTRDRSKPDCNGPLPSSGPYRVKFLVIDSSNAVKAETLWSDDITLKKANNPFAIDTSIVRRSAGMIVITTILSILLAILLGLMIAVLVYGWSDLCRLPTFSWSGFYHVRHFGSLRVHTYATHHIPSGRVAENLWARGTHSNTCC
ncbi:uroplakin-3b-like protein 1 [Ambystoma mexicanum]|uniref:uroplakin-3b-like protein 1 n=1 Tax=Ambystoma mexicanum TaxID=8296 RepID=UPI0037E97A3E